MVDCLFEYHGYQLLSPYAGQGEDIEVRQPYGMLLLLDLLLSAIFEGPLDDVGLRTGTLDMLALGKLSPEMVEILELDKMPHLGEWGCNN